MCGVTKFKFNNGMMFLSRVVTARTHTHTTTRTATPWVQQIFPGIWTETDSFMKKSGKGLSIQMRRIHPCLCHIKRPIKFIPLDLFQMARTGQELSQRHVSMWLFTDLQPQASLVRKVSQGEMWDCVLNLGISWCLGVWVWMPKKRARACRDFEYRCTRTQLSAVEAVSCKRHRGHWHLCWCHLSFPRTIGFCSSFVCEVVCIHLVSVLAKRSLVQQTCPNMVQRCVTFLMQAAIYQYHTHSLWSN